MTKLLYIKRAFGGRGQGGHITIGPIGEVGIQVAATVVMDIMVEDGGQVAVIIGEAVAHMEEVEEEPMVAAVAVDLVEEVAAVEGWDEVVVVQDVVGAVEEAAADAK